MLNLSCDPLPGLSRNESFNRTCKIRSLACKACVGCFRCGSVPSTAGAGHTAFQSLTFGLSQQDESL